MLRIFLLNLDFKDWYKNQYDDNNEKYTRKYVF